MMWVSRHCCLWHLQPLAQPCGATIWIWDKVQEPRGPEDPRFWSLFSIHNNFGPIFRTPILNHSLIGLGANQGCHNLCSLCLRFGDQWNSVDDSHMCLRACNKMVHGSAPRSPSLDKPSLIAAAASAMAASWLLLAGGNTSAIDFTAPRKSDSVVLTLLSRRHQW